MALEIFFEVRLNLFSREDFKEWFLQGFYGRSDTRNPITCALCETALSFVVGWIREGMPLEQINNNTVALCKTLQIVDDEICEMVVPIYSVMKQMLYGRLLQEIGEIDKWTFSYQDPLYFMITSHSWLTVYDACGIVLGGDLLPGCFAMNNSMTDWVIDVDYAMRPPVIEHPLVPVRRNITNIDFKS